MNDVVSQIRTMIELIRPSDQLEQEHILDALRWIDSGAPLFRIEKPDKPPKHLVAYFVIIDPGHQSILLGDHITAQLWLPSGGHVEPGENPKSTVLREAKEELNLETVFLRNIDTPFFITQTQTVGLTAGHTDVSIWYLLRSNIHDKLTFDRREYSDMAWFAFDEIISSHPAIFDAHMHRFTRKLIQYLSPTGCAAT